MNLARLPRPSAEMFLADDRWSYAISSHALAQINADFNFPAQIMTVDAVLNEV